MIWLKKDGNNTLTKLFIKKTMKKLIILILVISTIGLTSCGNPVYKKRKKCTGNGSWYGNRNLGETKPTHQNTYVLK